MLDDEGFDVLDEILVYEIKLLRSDDTATSLEIITHQLFIIMQQADDDEHSDLEMFVDEIMYGYVDDVVSDETDDLVYFDIDEVEVELHQTTHPDTEGTDDEVELMVLDAQLQIIEEDDDEDATDVDDVDANE